MIDFKANDRSAMIETFKPNEKRGGAQNTIAPEIWFAPMKIVELNYIKADIWSLGVILATMAHPTLDPAVAVEMKTKQLHTSFTTTTAAVSTPSVISNRRSSGSNMSALINEMIIKIVILLPSERLSCYDVYQRTSTISMSTMSCTTTIT
jgi:serine/threonine protein kinase